MRRSCSSNADSLSLKLNPIWDYIETLEAWMTICAPTLNLPSFVAKWFDVCVCVYIYIYVCGLCWRFKLANHAGGTIVIRLPAFNLSRRVGHSQHFSDASESGWKLSLLLRTCRIHHSSAGHKPLPQNTLHDSDRKWPLNSVFLRCSPTRCLSVLICTDQRKRAGKITPQKVHK